MIASPGDVLWLNGDTSQGGVAYAVQHHADGLPLVMWYEERGNQEKKPCSRVYMDSGDLGFGVYPCDPI